MSSHRRYALKRSVLSALAAVLAAAVPALWGSPALAEKPAKKAAPTEDKEAAKPRRAKKPHTVKKTASRDPAGSKSKARKAAAEAPKRRCTGAPITIDRSGLERQTLTLVDCRERPLESAREALSVLARPWGAAKPVERTPRLHSLAHAAHPGPAAGPGELAPGVRLLDRGLLVRLDAVARHYPGRPISLVSGYRPQSRGSLHQAARALDLRVAGVPNEELVAFCKTLPDTGCGYYPNSSFVHLDVRGSGVGSVTWIDASGPGQAPHYVPTWPPPAEQADRAVLPPDTSADPWSIDPADEHAPDREPSP